MTLCVYAVMARPRGRESRIAVDGATGERLRIVAAGPLAAVVGQVRRKPAPTADVLRRYEGTIAALAASVSALLPVRFGTCLDTTDELIHLLQSRRSGLQAALARVRQRVQMTVRVLGQGVDLPSAAAGGRSAGAGAAYLRARAADAARAREVAGFESVRIAVRRWVRHERVEKRAGIATVYHLIPRASVSRYREAVTRAAAAAGLHVIVTGPWAPYAFAEW